MTTNLQFSVEVVTRAQVSLYSGIAPSNSHACLGAGIWALVVERLKFNSIGKVLLL